MIHPPFKDWYFDFYWRRACGHRKTTDIKTIAYQAYLAGRRSIDRESYSKYYRQMWQRNEG